MKIKPLADRVVIEPALAEDKVKGGIIIPDTAKEKPQKGTVVAVGPGKASDSGNVISMTVKKGDSVLYGKYSGSEVNIDNKEYLIVREDDILAIIE